MLAAFGGAAATWPFAARAQQAERVRRIGVLMAATADDPENQTRIGAFHQGLAALGWTDGRNLRVDTRWAATNADAFASTRSNWPHLRRMQSWLVLALRPSRLLLQATRTVPIVFVVVVDPVGTGFVASLARPGGNATGFLMFEYGLSSKWLEVLKQIAPGVRRVAVFRDRHPVRGAITRDGSQSDQRTRRRRDRARHHRLGARSERRGDHGGTNIIGAASSRSDRRACIAAPACGLPQPRVRHPRRPDLLCH